jgi:hypothetical protein
MSYYLRLLNVRGELVESFAPGPLTAMVKLAADKVGDFDKYPTVYRVIRLTGGLYARPFQPLPPQPKARRKKAQTPLIVHIVSADLYHLDHKPN